MVPTALVAVITYVPLVTLCVSFLLRAHLQRAGDGAGLGVEVQRLGERRGDGEGIRGAAAVVRLLHDERHVHLGREHVVAQPGGSLARLEGLAVVEESPEALSNHHLRGDLLLRVLVAGVLEEEEVDAGLQGHGSRLRGQPAILVKEDGRLLVVVHVEGDASRRVHSERVVCGNGDLHVEGVEAGQRLVETVVETRPRVDSGGKVFLHLEARDDDAGGRCARREVGERIETVRENVIPETGGNTTSVGNFGYDEAIPIRLLL